MNKWFFVSVWTLLNLASIEGICQGFKFSGKVNPPSPNGIVSFLSVAPDLLTSRRIEDIVVRPDGTFSFNYPSGETGTYQLVYNGKPFRVVFRGGQNIKFKLEVAEKKATLTAAGSDELTKFLEFKEQEKLLLDSNRNSERYELLKKLPTCLTLYATCDDWELAELATIKEAVNEVSKKELENTFSKKLVGKIESLDKITIGSTIPDIKLPDQQGKPIAVSDFRGSYVLIDFWASWCGPCREESPNLVANYKKFRDSGFRIYSVSLDGKREKWLEAIQKDHLNWIHVSSLSGWGGNVVRDFNISGIPSNILIDKQGKILAWNLMGEELSERLSLIFEKK